MNILIRFHKAKIKAVKIIPKIIELTVMTVRVT